MTQRPEPGAPTVLFLGDDVRTAAAVGIAVRRHIRLEAVSTARDALRLLAAVAPVLAIVDPIGHELDAALVIDTIGRDPSTCRVALVVDPLAPLPGRIRGTRIDELLPRPLQIPALLRCVEAATAASSWFSPQVTRAIEHVRDHCAQSLTVPSIADAVGVSWSSLAHRFPIEIGVTPGEYVRRVRVEIARRLLIETRDKLESIAATTGFCDAAHLSKVFRRTVGDWPGHYRAAGAGTALDASSKSRPA